MEALWAFIVASLPAVLGFLLDLLWIVILLVVGSKLIKFAVKMLKNYLKSRYGEE